MRVKRSRTVRRGKADAHRVRHTDSPGRQANSQLRRLRLWIVLLSLAVACLLAGMGIFFWVQFSTPFREAAQRNAENTPSEIYQNHQEFPLYDDAETLVIASTQHPLSADVTVSLKKVEGIEVDSRVVPYLKAMLRAARADGIDLQLQSGYVSPEEQHAVYEKHLQRLQEKGLSRLKAAAAADRSVGDANCSDFQTGLAVCFQTEESGSFAETAAYRWLQTNGIAYGFVLRYPSGKTYHTRHDAAPEHFRFVGVEHAGQMRRLDLCLEEYANYQAMQGNS